MCPAGECKQPPFLCYAFIPRGGTKSLIFHVIFVHTNARHHVPILLRCVKAKKLQDPKGISTSNVIVLIADTVFAWGFWGITPKTATEVYYKLPTLLPDGEEEKRMKKIIQTIISNEVDINEADVEGSLLLHYVKYMQIKVMHMTQRFCLITWSFCTSSDAYP